MKKIERRAFVCLALALLLAAGLGFFLVKYFLDGGSWASSAFNRHLYNSSGQLASGTVLDRDGDVLSEVVDGQRTYYDNATVRKATLHAVGDLQGNIGTGALNAFADKLTGYSLLNGAFGAQRGNDLYLTIDARYNYTAYAALEDIPDLADRTWTCSGSVQMGDETIICSGTHGEQDIASAFANSCNVAFAQIAQELGPGTLEKYTEQAGLTGSYSISGLPTAKGSFDFDNITDGQLGWAGVGQYHDQVNPAALMIYMGAIANGGKAAEPYLILRTESALGLPSLPHFTTRTGTLISADTAAALADLMANNVTQTYGASRFPNMDICAKSGTAEVGEGQTPHAWFAGFLRGEETPYAFVVLVENGGGGSSVAGGVAAKVLDVIVNGY